MEFGLPQKESQSDLKPAMASSADRSVRTPDKDATLPISTHPLETIEYRDAVAGDKEVCCSPNKTGRNWRSIVSFSGTAVPLYFFYNHGNAKSHGNASLLD